MARGQGHHHAARWAALALAMTGIAAPGCILDRSGTAPSVDAGPFDAGPFDAGDRDAGEVDAEVDAGRLDAGPISEVPGPPGDPRFEGVTDTSIAMVWTPPVTGGPVDTYEVERADDAGGSPGSFATVASDLGATALTDDGLSPSTIYWYRVRARNGVGLGEASMPQSVSTSAPLAVSIVQSTTADANNPTASFAAPPTAGHLLVAIGMHRLQEATPSIDGFEMRINTHFQTTTADRRGFTMWTRIAGASEPTDVQLRWSPSHESQLIVLEIAANAAVTWSFRQAAEADSGTEYVEELTVTGTDLPPASYVLVGGLGTRSDTNADVVFTGLPDALSARGPRTAAAGIGLFEGGTPSTTATWAWPRHVSMGLVAMEIVR